MILYFTGTGNSAYVAKQLGEKLNDEVINLFEKIKNHFKLESIEISMGMSSDYETAFENNSFEIWKKDYEIISELTPRKCGSFKGLSFRRYCQLTQ